MAVGHFFGETTMIKKITILAVVVLLFVPAVNAEEAITDTLGVIGKWKVWGESPNEEKEKKKVDNIWEFKSNGDLHAVSEDPRTKTLDLTTKYYIEDGMVMKQKVGRPDKYDRCGVQITGDEMILKCPGLYFFMTKINK
jgi:hypothetical protein